MGAFQVWSSAPAWIVIVVGLAAVVSSSEAYVFNVGSNDGWVLDPSESYNHWAGRNRFQVNDTIVFTHEQGVDSVLEVTEQDFDTCNTRSPVRRLQAAVGSGGGGSSVLRLDRSGPFFFISSDEDRCQKGQKLYIIVMAVRGPTTPPAPAVAPAPDSALPPAPAVAPAPAPDSAFPPAWASAPENAQAPPPTAGASSRLVIDEAIIGSVVGVIGALVLCAV